VAGSALGTDKLALRASFFCLRGLARLLAAMCDEVVAYAGDREMRYFFEDFALDLGRRELRRGAPWLR
jgi:hypothetical protein